MRYLAILIAAASFLQLDPSQVSASTLVLAAQQYTVDTDGDSVPDVVDNAPGVANNQADADADAIGDPVDPTPNVSIPYLGDPGLGVYSSPNILAGGTATFDYLMVNATPPGSWGRIELDFDLDNSTDAVYFGALTVGLNTIAIPANFFVNGSWDLNTPGFYSVGMKAFAPGMWSQNWAYPNVTVLPVPEPSTLCLFATAAAMLLCRARIRRDPWIG